MKRVHHEIEGRVRELGLAAERYVRIALLRAIAALAVLFMTLSSVST